MIHLIGNFLSALFLDGRKGVSMFNVQMVILSPWNLEGILFPTPIFVGLKNLDQQKENKHMPGRTASSFAQALGFITPFQHIWNGTSQIHDFIAGSTLVLPLNAHTWDVFALGEAQQMGKLDLGEGFEINIPNRLKSTNGKLVVWVPVVWISGMLLRKGIVT